MPASETLQIDTSSPSETRVIKKIIFLRKHKAVKPGGRSPFFLKDDGEVLTSELRKLMWPIYTGGYVSRGLCESVSKPIYEKGNRHSCENYR